MSGADVDTARYDALTKQLNDVDQAMGNVDQRVSAAIKSIADLAKGTDVTATSFKKLSEGPTEDFLKQTANQAKKAAAAIAVTGDKVATLIKKGQGSSDYARGLASSLAIEKDIFEISADKTKLLSENLLLLESEAEATLDILMTSKDATAEEIEQARINRDKVRNLREQAGRARSLNSIQEKGQELQKKIAEFGENFATTQGKALLASAALSKVLSFASKETLNMQQAVGGTAAESAAMAAEMRASLGAMGNLTGFFTGADKMAINAANQARITADNLDLANQMAIGVNEAVLAQQTGLEGAQIAELAQMMSEVTDVSREGASAQLTTVRALAMQNRVAPAKVFSSMAQNSTVLAAMTDGSADSMGRLAVLAAKAGVELSQLESIADSLLNIETSIAAEFEAEVLLGKQLNLDAARRFALNNDNEGLIREIQKNLQGTNFGDLNRLQRQSLAQALGTDVASLGRIIARSDNQELEDVGQQQLQTMTDLNVQASLTNELLSQISRGIDFLLIAQAAGGVGNLVKAFSGSGGGGFLANMMTKGGNFAKNNPRLAKGLRFGGGGLAAAGVGFNAFQNFTDDSLSGPMALLKTLDQNKATTLLTGLAAYGTLGMGVPAAAALGQTIDAFLPNVGSLFGAYANGGPVTESGLAMVGERGPELVALGRGSHVVPNHYLGGYQAGATNMQISDPETHRALMTIASHLESINTNTANTSKGVGNIGIATGA